MKTLIRTAAALAAAACSLILTALIIKLAAEIAESCCHKYIDVDVE